MASRKRQNNESFKDYRKALLIQEQLDKYRSKGQLFWNSAEKGTYHKLKPEGEANA